MNYQKRHSKLDVAELEKKASSLYLQEDIYRHYPTYDLTEKEKEKIKLKTNNISDKLAYLRMVIKDKMEDNDYDIEYDENEVWNEDDDKEKFPINLIEFNILDGQIFNNSPKVQTALTKPSNLTKVLLISDYWKDKHRLLDFTGTTVKEAIDKIITFYKHKTYRRLVGDHTFFEGFYKDSDDNMIISLGS
jgi:hypothetical protein